MLPRSATKGLCYVRTLGHLVSAPQPGVQAIRWVHEQLQTMGAEGGPKMKVKTLKKKLENLPDDADVMLYNGETSDGKPWLIPIKRCELRRYTLVRTGRVENLLLLYER